MIMVGPVRVIPMSAVGIGLARVGKNGGDGDNNHKNSDEETKYYFNFIHYFAPDF